MKGLVLFGSTSDDKYQQKIVKQLEASFEVESAVISAHRDPDKLEKRLSNDDYKFIVAGAGLAAHLPGVCASKTKRPVFGIPVAGCFRGLDALLSIQQMPFGVPVASFGVENWSLVKTLQSKIENLENENLINIVCPKELYDTEFFKKEMNRTREYATGLNYEIILSENHREEAFNIYMVHPQNEMGFRDDSLMVPLLSTDQKNDPATALWMMEEVNKGGFWLGANNTRNAICFYNQLINSWRNNG